MEVSEERKKQVLGELYLRLKTFDDGSNELYNDWKEDNPDKFLIDYLEEVYQTVKNSYDRFGDKWIDQLQEYYGTDFKDTVFISQFTGAWEEMEREKGKLIFDPKQEQEK